MESHSTSSNFLDEKTTGNTRTDREVWVTGIGLVSSLGIGVGTHRNRLLTTPVQPNVDTATFAPYAVHPLADIALGSQIKSKSDLRQMGRWQQIGVYAAGLALDDAHLSGDMDRLAETDLVVAAGNGERESKADEAILNAIRTAPTGSSPLVAALQSSLRPTLYLCELTNLLAGNISIVHGVTKSSRTFKGEEQAGLAAIADAVSRIRAGTSHTVLAGGACNAERHDLLLSLELGNNLWHGEHMSIRERVAAGGGIVLGSVGAFIVLEDAEHAKARGVTPYARVAGIEAERTELRPFDDVVGRSPIQILSGASGVSSAFEREMAWIDSSPKAGKAGDIRFHGDALGHGVEAHFATGIALAAMALSESTVLPPFAADDASTSTSVSIPSQRIIVTQFGHWRGAGAALMESIEVMQ